MAILSIRNLKEILWLHIVIFLFCSCGVIKGRISSAQNEPHTDGATFFIIKNRASI